MIAQYKGYDIYRSLINESWYAYPACDMTTENKITAATVGQLKAQIDQLATDYQPNPWELPSSSHQLAIAA